MSGVDGETGARKKRKLRIAIEVEDPLEHTKRRHIHLKTNFTETSPVNLWSSVFIYIPGERQMDKSQKMHEENQDFQLHASFRFAFQV